MEIQLFQDVATIVTFVAPGYFAIQIYSLMHAKRDREFSRLLIESVVYSLPIVALGSVVWHVFFQQPPQSIDVLYVALLIGVALVTGALAGWLRMHWPIERLSSWLHIDEPNSNFIKSEFRRINTTKPETSAVTIRLKSGATFSGTIDQMSRYTHNEQLHFSFTNIAWYDSTKNKWDERTGNIIVARDEIEYIETGQLIDT
jgi:hypothetical protein